MKFHVSFLACINSDTKRAVVTFLLTHTAAMSEREIASILQISHLRLNRTLKELAQVHFVSSRTVGRAHVWHVHRKSFAFKIFSYLIKTLSKMQRPLDALQQTIVKKLPRDRVEKVVLFGSIPKGIENVHSDIDVCIIVKNTNDKCKIEPWIDTLSTDCFELFGNRLAPYIVTRQEMRQKQQLPIIEAIQQGCQIFPLNPGTP